jgi:hypothetical protein
MAIIVLPFFAAALKTMRAFSVYPKKVALPLQRTLLYCVRAQPSSAYNARSGQTALQRVHKREEKNNRATEDVYAN